MQHLHPLKRGAAAPPLPLQQQASPSLALAPGQSAQSQPKAAGPSALPKATAVPPALGRLPVMQQQQGRPGPQVLALGLLEEYSFT